MMAVEEIFAEIKKLYNKNPLGWQISVNKDINNHGNILISNPNFKSLWQIKLDSLYRPNPIGVGAKIQDIEIAKKIIDSNVPSFGYRPLLEEQLEKLQSYTDKKSIDSLVMDILNKDPLPLDNVQDKGVLEGPVLFSPPGYVSDKQRDLDLKLKHDLNQLKHRRGLGLQYI